MAQSERAAAAEQFAQIETLVAELTQAVATATTAQTKASSALPDLREKEAEAAAALQRLMVARDALDAEERRIETLRDEIQNRVAQIDADIGRENLWAGTRPKWSKTLEREATEIRAAQTREADDLATAKARLLEAEAEVEQRERELTELTRSVVADETRGHAKPPVDGIRNPAKGRRPPRQYHQGKAGGRSSRRR